MHVHAIPLASMRTTIDLRDDQRARLLEIAAQQGRKGSSHLVQEAVDHSLAEDEGRPKQVAEALVVVGSFAPEDAQGLRDGNPDPPLSGKAAAP